MCRGWAPRPSASTEVMEDPASELQQALLAAFIGSSVIEPHSAAAQRSVSAAGFASGVFISSLLRNTGLRRL